MFFNLGMQEMIIVGAVAVLLFGKRLPDVARVGDDLAFDADPSREQLLLDEAEPVAQDHDPPGDTTGPLAPADHRPVPGPVLQTCAGRAQGHSEPQPAMVRAAGAGPRIVRGPVDGRRRC